MGWVKWMGFMTSTYKLTFLASCAMQQYEHDVRAGMSDLGVPSPPGIHRGNYFNLSISLHIVHLLLCWAFWRAFLWELRAFTLDRSDFGVGGGEEALVGIGVGRWDWSLYVRRSGRSCVRMEDGGSALEL